MHTPLYDVYVCWRQLPTGVTNVCRLSLIGDKLYSAENLAWRKSVGVAEIGKRTGGDDSDWWGRGESKRGAPSKEGGVSPRNVFASPKK